MRYRFGDYLFDTERYELHRAGVLVPLLLPKELSVRRVDWLVDGQLVGSTGRNEHRFLWPLARGMYTVQAQVWQDAHDAPAVTSAVEFVVK